MSIISRFEISKQVHKSTYSMHSAHSHSYYEMFYLISGSCDLLLNNSIYHFKPGNIIFIPPDVIHRTSYTGYSYHERIYIEFTPNYMNELICQFGIEWYNYNLFSQILYVPQEYRSDINHLLNLLIKERHSGDSFSTVAIKLYFQELVIKILRHLEASNIAVVNNNFNFSDMSVKTAVDYINTHFKNDITLKELADLLHLNPSYFSKKFKKVNKKGFKEYLNSVRINNSEKLLLETDMSITEIAFECGYDNSNYFGDAFKKVNGVSPTAFRQLKGNIGDSSK